MTNDTTWNVWQGGIQEILINSLSNSEELKVRQAEYINRLVENHDQQSEIYWESAYTNNPLFSFYTQ